MPRKRKHAFSLRRERRLSVAGRHVEDWNTEDAYPCKASCTAHREHGGKTVYLYAHCSCGWESFVGDDIYRAANTTEARLRHLQHQIDVLVEKAEGCDAA